MNSTMHLEELQQTATSPLTVEMSHDSREEIEHTKIFLLKYNPSKIDHDNQQEILQQFVECSKQLFVYFEANGSGVSDSLGLLATDTFSIWILRTSQVISNKKIDTSGYVKIVRGEILTIERSTTIFEYVIDFWMHGNPAFINALKDLFDKFLRLLRLIHPSTECDKLFSSWLDKTLKVPADLPVQYYLIEALAEELDLYPVLQNRPAFVKSSLSLMRSDILSNPIGKSLSRILINVFHNHFEGNVSYISNWLRLWQDEVMNCLSDYKRKKAIELYILQPVFKEMPPEAFTAFVGGIKSGNPLVLLSVVQVGQELGIEEEPFHNDRLIPLSTVGEFLKLDEFKLAAFELLTFSPKKSSPVHSYIFELIKGNLTAFFVDTRIEVRNYFCSSFKHFIYRIRDSAHSLYKNASSLKRANKFPAEQKQKFDYVLECQLFLDWLLDFLKLQICPGTQYQRNDVALKLLQIIIESGLDNSIATKYLDMKNARSYPFSISLFRDSAMIRLLFDMLASNYADIRQMTKSLLLMALESSRADALRESINWDDLKSQADTFLREYQFSDIGAALESVRFYASTDKMRFLTQMTDSLLLKVKNSRDDYLEHINEPISGYLTSLALILDENQLDERLKQLIVKNCIDIVLINWSAVKHVICHESCEENLSLMYPDGNINAQLVLSTAFRTTKEASSLLRTLIAKYPLSKNQLNEIGDFLISQLFDIRHSGAFQSVTPTFSALCLRCKKENANQLMEWLKVIMRSVQVKTQNITRRSGGIPPMLAVILSAESGKDRPLLKYAFERLIQIASTTIEAHQDKVDLPQVNAFNCIKAIFTESKLSQACEPYTSPALSLSLKHFDSEIWALRNCSIMLFTSLQNRLFGKSGKSVSARMFFTRYPGIREELLDILRASASDASVTAKNSKQQSQIESIFLVLSILLRLKPTPGYRGLDAFNSEIRKCLRSSNWSVREMAARTISSLAENPIEVSREIAEVMTIQCQNSLHGNLLAVNEMFVSSKGFQCQKPSIALIQMLYGKSDELLGNNWCYSTANTYISLMGNVLSLSDENLFQEQRNGLIDCISQFFNRHYRVFRIDGSKQLCVANALQTLFRFGESERASVLLEQGILSPFYEVQKIALNFAINSSDSLVNITDDFVVSLKSLLEDQTSLPSLCSLSLRALQKFNEKIDTGLLLTIIKRPRSEDMQLAAIEALGRTVTPDESEILEEVICRFSAEDQPVDFRLACFQSLKNYSDVTNNVTFLLLLNKMLSDDDEDVRQAVASFLNINFNLAGEELTPNPVETSRMLISYLVKSFSRELLSKSAIGLLKEFLGSYDWFKAKIDIAANGVFEKESDNQFRNTFEQNMEYCELLEVSDFNNDFKVWLIALKDKVTTYLNQSRIIDGPFGWASSGDVFSRLLVLRALLKSTGVDHMASFDQVLLERKIHPVILSQALPHPADSCLERLGELKLSSSA